MATPVVFVHGLWLHAHSWQPWIERFEREGYSATAPGWPGDGATPEETRANADAVAGYGIAEVADHFAAEIRKLDQKPIVVGHSFGGLIVQKLLGDDVAAAAVAIDPAPAKGIYFLPPSSLRVASIALRDPRNRNRAVALTPEQFRYGFGNELSRPESDELYARWAIPSPGKPLFEAAFANLMPSSPAKVRSDNAGRGPLLITAGGHDHTVPATLSHHAARLYRHSGAVTDLIDFPDRGHSLTIDARWGEVAERVLDWLRQHPVS